MMHLSSLMILVVTFTNAIEKSDEIKEAFKIFQNKYAKSYTKANEPIRFHAFLENMKKTIVMNKKHSLSGGNAIFGITQFSDLTEKEFQEKYLSNFMVKSDILETKNIDFKDPPASIDWRTKGAVSPVHKLDYMSSTLIYPSIDTIASVVATREKKIPVLSFEQVKDCCSTCRSSGGLLNDVFDYVEKYGLQSEYDSSRSNCAYNRTLVVLHMSGSTKITDELSLRDSVSKAPVLVAITVGDPFQHYTGGVMTDCGSPMGSLALEVVGYNVDIDEPYWILKNAWGTDWGEKGYIRIAAGKNICGIGSFGLEPNITTKI